MGNTIEALKTEAIENRVEYPGGSVSYRKFGKAEQSLRRIFLVPGFTEDSVTMEDLACELSASGHEVLAPNQPDYYKNHHLAGGLSMSGIDHHAQAYLAIIEAEGMAQEPLAFVAHSMGAQVLARMAEIAKQKGYAVTDNNEGSQAIFLAPAGANRSNMLFSHSPLAKRYLIDFMKRDGQEIKQFDPDKIIMKRSVRNGIRNPLKTFKEILFLKKKEKLKNLGEYGLKPTILFFADDPLMPSKLSEAVIDDHISEGEDYSINGWSTVAERAGEEGGSWLDKVQHAGHNDHARHPERVAKVVLGFIDKDAEARLADLRQATRNLTEAEKQSKVIVAHRPKT